MVKRKGGCLGEGDLGWPYERERESITWELESRMKESYPELFLSGNF